MNKRMSKYKNTCRRGLIVTLCKKNRRRSKVDEKGISQCVEEEQSLFFTWVDVKSVSFSNWIIDLNDASASYP